MLAGTGIAQPDSLLDPDAIAATYLHVLKQPRSTWTWEVELRPYVERALNGAGTPAFSHGSPAFPKT